MKKTKLYIGQYILCGFLALIINWLLPGLFIAYDLRLPNYGLISFIVFFVAYPLLVFIWHLFAAKRNCGEGAYFWWFFVGYFISVLPIIFLFLAFIVARQGSNF